MKSCEEMYQDLLERREEYLKKQKKRNLLFGSAGLVAVCCVCLAVWVGFGTPGIPRSELPAVLPASEQEEPSSSRGEESEVQKTPEQVPGNGEIEESYTVYTDPVQLPESSPEVAADMVGCLVYRGKVYTQPLAFSPMNLKTGLELLDEPLGEAKGNLDCFTAQSQENWQKEFASTYTGTVWSIKGYSEEFRLGILMGSGEDRCLQLMDNYDAIGLNTGADLFEERLHLPGRVEKVECLAHDAWEYAETEKIHELGVSGEEFSAFLQELCSGPFVRFDPKEQPGIYDRETQGHLYLTLEDGTCTDLRLIEGGYVGCQSLGWIFVEMPGEIFDAVLAASNAE